MRVPAEQIRGQLVSVFRAWGMSDAHAATTAEMMVETDLRGVDSHGIGMLPTYDQEFRNGRIYLARLERLRARPELICHGPHRHDERRDARDRVAHAQRKGEL